MKGASRRSGPPPDPNALKRDRDEGSWTTLPAAGREGEVPEWPLANQTEREQVFWESEWSRPQAVMWERNGQAVEVAMYVRALGDAEQLNATVASRTLVRQLQEALGISIPGLLRNRWKIEAEETPSVRRRPSVSSTRERFKVVAGGAA